ncbi:MAG: hypothetical protein Q8P52_01005 [bacterium]|nr:hypothetical protein [bacterium]
MNTKPAKSTVFLPIILLWMDADGNLCATDDTIVVVLKLRTDQAAEYMNAAKKRQLPVDFMTVVSLGIARVLAVRGKGLPQAASCRPLTVFMEPTNPILEEFNKIVNNAAPQNVTPFLVDVTELCM